MLGDVYTSPDTISPTAPQLLSNKRTGASPRDMFEFARFLLCCALSEGGSSSLSPSARVDVVWHEALLFPKAYAALCDSLTGGKGLIDHDPLRAYRCGEARDARRVRTCSEYVRIIGESPPDEIWMERCPALSGVPKRTIHDKSTPVADMVVGLGPEQTSTTSTTPAAHEKKAAAKTTATPLPVPAHAIAASPFVTAVDSAANLSSELADRVPCASVLPPHVALLQVVIHQHFCRRYLTLHRLG